MRAVVRVAMAMAILGHGPLGAQATGNGMSMPYAPAAVEIDTAVFSFATDSVAHTFGIPPLRAVSLPNGVTEVRVWVGFGIAIPHLLLRLTSHGGEVAGELVRWWHAMDHPSSDPRFAGFLDEQKALAGAFDCNEQHNGHRWVEMRDGSPTPHRGWTFACKADYGGDEPDWSGILARLTSLGVTELPDPGDLTPEPLRITDGTSLEVEVLIGARYRTYTYSNPAYQPWPEADSAQAIIEVLLELHRQQALAVVGEGAPEAP